MADNKLRCALIYRLETGKTSTAAFGGDNSSDNIGAVDAVVLAKFDHAGSYESQGGGIAGEEAVLYGGRDKAYAEAVALVISNDPPSGLSEQNSLGGFKVAQSDQHQVVYGVDADGICLAVITGLAYPSRVAIQLLQELYGDFAKQHGEEAKTAAANALTRKCKTMLTAICKKYDDVTKVDKTAAISGKVDEIKVQMQDNIAGMLRNTEQAESLAEKSDVLNEQASVFKKKSTDLRKHMQCKNMKMTALLVGIVVVILLVILISVIVKVKQLRHK